MLPYTRRPRSGGCWHGRWGPSGPPAKGPFAYDASPQKPFKYTTAVQNIETHTVKVHKYSGGFDLTPGAKQHREYPLGYFQMILS